MRHKRQSTNELIRVDPSVLIHIECGKKLSDKHRALDFKFFLSIFGAKMFKFCFNFRNWSILTTSHSRSEHLKKSLRPFLVRLKSSLPDSNFYFNFIIYYDEKLDILLYTKTKEQFKRCYHIQVLKKMCFSLFCFSKLTIPCHLA